MWEMLLPSLVSAGANILGGSMASQGAASNNAIQLAIANQNAQLQRETNAQNVGLFHENQDWQERMSNTAYQRQMSDMRSAGLNPILAYQKGGGASSPSVSTPNLAAPQLSASLENSQGEIGRSIGLAANSAMSAARSVAEIENARANNSLIREQEKKTTNDAALSAANTLKSLSETDLTKEQIKNMPQVMKLLIGQTTAAHAAAGASSATASAVSQDAARKEESGDSWLGHQVNTMKRLWGSIPQPTSAKPVGGRGPDQSFPNLWKKVFGK